MKRQINRESLSDKANADQVPLTPGEDWLTQSMARTLFITLRFQSLHRGHQLLHFGHDPALLGGVHEGFQARPRIQPSNWARVRSAGGSCG